jgi:hypothetical protein
MQVRGTSSSSVQPPLTGDAAGTAAAAAANESAAQSTASPETAYVPSSELVQLTTLAQAQPDVRPDVLLRVGLSLTQGDYATPDSAAQTADAILSALD